jgi:hypothetical protein
MVSRIFPSWNQLDGWLRQLDGLRRVSRMPWSLAVAGRSSQDLPSWSPYSQS